MNNKKRHIARFSKKHEQGDRTLFAIIGILLVFGVIMIHNATVVYSQGLFGGAYRLVFLQIGWILAGLVGFMFFYRYDYQKIGKIAYLLMVLTIIPLLILSFFGFLNWTGLLSCSTDLGFSPCINGAYRWLYLNPPPLPRIPVIGLLGFQPSELAKFSLILYLSVQITKTIKERGNVFMVYLLTAGLIAGLIIMQPNMSTAVLVFFIATAIYFASGAPFMPLAITLPALSVLGLIAMISSPYRRARLMTLIGENADKDLSLGYHIKQIMISLGSGGFFGVGFGQSRQKFQYLPEVASDSIFAIIGEEMGFLGTTFVVLLFTFFIYKGLTIARDAPDLLGRLLAVGITSWIGLQFFVNIAAMTRMIPLTGIPIPLISYGGSSMIFSLMALGILANISARSRN